MELATRMAILKYEYSSYDDSESEGSKSSHAAKPDHTWMPWTGLEANVVGPHGKIDAEVTIDFPEQITSSDLSATAPTVIRVLCKTAGRHWLNVTFEGEHVVGSPFEINALVGPPVRCQLLARQDAHGCAVVRMGVTNLVKVSVFDKFGNVAFLMKKIHTAPTKGNLRWELSNANLCGC